MDFGNRRYRFNPRARTGRDTKFGVAFVARTGFNPRARTGRDAPEMIVKCHLLKFQSTRPHGARLYEIQGVFPSTHCFNPRARTGRDFQKPQKPRDLAGFNPRARTGRDFEVLPIVSSHLGFNPRARTGRDLHPTKCSPR